MHINSSSLIFQSDNIKTPVYKLFFDDDFVVRTYKFEELVNQVEKSADKKLVKKTTKNFSGKELDNVDKFENPISVKISDFKSTLNKILKPLPVQHTLSKQSSTGLENKKKRSNKETELMSYFVRNNYNINLFHELFNNISSNLSQQDLEDNNYSIIVVRARRTRKIYRDRVSDYEDTDQFRLFLFIIEGKLCNINEFNEDVHVFTEGIKTNDENSMISLVVNKKIDSIMDKLCNIETLEMVYPFDQLDCVEYVYKLRVMRITAEKFQHGLFLIDKNGSCKYIAINNNHKKKVIKFELKDVKAVVKYRYLMQYNAVNIFLYTKDSSMIFDFENQQETDIILEYFRSKAPRIDKNFNDIKYHTNMWVDGLITNFDYIMYLNTMASRSFLDLSQYPIMPWVISNYEHEECN